MCGHSKRRCGFVRYGLYRAGKVKLTNEPNFQLIVNEMHTERPKITHQLKTTSNSTRYSKKNMREHYENELQNAKQDNEAIVLNSRIEKLEFGMEKQALNEMVSRDYSRRMWSKSRNHKKWHGNHRDLYTSREIEPNLIE